MFQTVQMETQTGRQALSERPAERADSSRGTERNSDSTKARRGEPPRKRPPHFGPNPARATFCSQVWRGSRSVCSELVPDHRYDSFSRGTRRRPAPSQWGVREKPLPQPQASLSAAAKNWSTLAADCAPVGWLRSVVASRGTRPWVCRAVLFSTLDVLLLWVRVHDTTYLES
jgi:hypothetical protein